MKRQRKHIQWLKKTGIWTQIILCSSKWLVEWGPEEPVLSSCFSYYDVPLGKFVSHLPLRRNPCFRQEAHQNDCQPLGIFSGGLPRLKSIPPPLWLSKALRNIRPSLLCILLQLGLTSSISQPYKVTDKTRKLTLGNFVSIPQCWPFILLFCIVPVYFSWCTLFSTSTPLQFVFGDSEVPTHLLNMLYFIFSLQNHVLNMEWDPTLCQPFPHFQSPPDYILLILLSLDVLS